MNAAEFSFHICIIFYPLYEDMMGTWQIYWVVGMTVLMKVIKCIWSWIGWLDIHRRSSWIYQCQMELSDHVFTAHSTSAEKSLESGRSASPVKFIESHWESHRDQNGCKESSRVRKPSKWWWMQAVSCILWSSSLYMM